jgi:hypothetical protein
LRKRKSTTFFNKNFLIKTWGTKMETMETMGKYKILDQNIDVEDFNIQIGLSEEGERHLVRELTKVLGIRYLREMNPMAWVNEIEMWADQSLDIVESINVPFKKYLRIERCFSNGIDGNIYFDEEHFVCHDKEGIPFYLDESAKDIKRQGLYLFIKIDRNNNIERKLK